MTPRVTQRDTEIEAAEAGPWPDFDTSRTGERDGGKPGMQKTPHPSPGQMKTRHLFRHI